MRPAARLQAAIDILDAVVAAARDGGPAADSIIDRHFRARRYAGSSDRRAIAELVWRAIRHAGERPPSGRAALLALLDAEDAASLMLFDGSPHGPAPIAPGERRATAGPAPSWLLPRLEESLGPSLAVELEASRARAPLDLRVNRLKAPDPDEVGAALPFATAPVTHLPLRLPFALRAAAGSRIDGHPLMRAGMIEVQDAGSQLVAALCAARPGETVVDLCAGAGGKSLALAADMEGSGRLIACDTAAARLGQLPPRAARAGAGIETRLLDPPREGSALQDLVGAADLVLVDAPCSGTGTWRRNPELRWRLTPSRLEALQRLQARLLRLGARLVRPGGRLVYAVCSLLDEEGKAQADRFTAEAASFRPATALRLSPAAHGCDGFFVASWFRDC
ncbi:RsmB/NOP family class I SAM-dependent RNA methyltransferase [Thermaurantiacus sp.]